MGLYELWYGLLCIPFAGLNAAWIEDGKKIRHGLNGAMHLLFASLGWYLYAWPVFILILCNTNIIFTISLNLYRDLPLNYTSKTTTSIIDQIENKLFNGDFYVSKLVYLLISIVCNVVYYQFYH